MAKFLYPIRKLEIETWIKYWLLKRSKSQGILSEIITGESPFTLENSINKKFKIFQVGGNSTQETRSGINLFDYDNYTYDKTIMSTYRFIEIKNLKANTSYTIYNYDVDLNDTNVTAIYLSRTSTYSGIVSGGQIRDGQTYYTSKTRDTNESGKMYLAAYALNGWTEELWNTFIGYFSQAMFVEGTATTAPYEPYGVMPSPEFPSTINNVTGNVNITVCNENMFNSDVLLEATNWTKDSNGVYSGTANALNNKFRFGVPGLKFKEKTAYTISLKASKTIGIFYIRFYYKDETSDRLTVEGTEMKEYSLTSDSEKNVDYIALAYGTNGSGIVSLKDIILNEGSVAASYVPHKEQAFIFPLGEDKLMLGDYLADDGIHHVRPQIDMSTLTWVSYATDKYRTSDLADTIKIPTSTAIAANIMATKYIPVPANATFVDGNIGVNASGNIIVYDTTGTPSGILEYELATPTITPYTAAQQAVYDDIKKAAHSYEGITHVSSTNETSPIFRIQYYKEEE